MFGSLGRGGKLYLGEQETQRGNDAEPDTPIDSLWETPQSRTEVVEVTCIQPVYSFCWLRKELSAGSVFSFEERNDFLSITSSLWNVLNDTFFFLMCEILVDLRLR